MVWKIRSKTAFVFANGTKRYHNPEWKEVPFDNINELPAIGVKTDSYSQVRIIHNYRNMSRSCKTFLLGDPIAEQYMLNMLRHEYYYIRDHMESPIFNYLPMVRYK